MAGLATLDALAEAIRPAWRPPFRGQIYEYARKLDLQDGYAVKGPFRIETLPHLVEPLEAVRDPHVRLVSIMGAVQTTKSLLVDITNPYWIEHDPGDVLWLLEDDAKARQYADRAICLIRSIPEIAALLQDVDGNDKTKTVLKFRHMKLVLCGLNAGNVQSLSWRYVIVDETWLHPWDGLIRQAMDRTRQYPDTKKIILLGQGGWEDDDHDREHKGTDQRVLHYACPACGKYQQFELSRQRPDDFPIEQLRGTYAGLSWDNSEVTKPNGRWNWEAVRRSAHHRCYFCDSRIQDTPDVRRRLGESFRYFPIGTVPDAAAPRAPFPEAVGFQWPAEASARVRFGDMAVKYIQAKEAEEHQAYKLPLQEFYQKCRGVPWSEFREGEYRSTIRETYNPREEWPEEQFRPLVIDCQRDLKKFYFTVFALSLTGEVRELERGTAGSWDELAQKQKDWQVKDQHVLVDCGYKMTEVLRECVRHGHVGTIKIGNKFKKIWLCWTGMKGSGRELFPHVHPKTQIKEWRIYSARQWYDTNVGTAQRSPRSPWYEWSNLHCKDMMRARRDGDPGVPKWLSLPDTLPPSDHESYFAQMRSEKRHERYTGGKKYSIWLPINDAWPNHYWDIANMLIAFQAIVGIIGSPEEPEGAEGSGTTDQERSLPTT